MPKVITIRYQKRPLHFIAGPYVERVGGTYGVKLAREIPAPADLSLPIDDFSVPGEAELTDALQTTVLAALSGQVPYIGCKGGIGRTGLFLACLHRVLTPEKEDSITWVRRVYLNHAVETEAQQRLVREFDVDMVRRALDLDPDGVVTLEEALARLIKWLRDPFQRKRRPSF